MGGAQAGGWGLSHVIPDPADLGRHEEKGVEKEEEDRDEVTEKLLRDLQVHVCMAQFSLTTVSFAPRVYSFIS